MNNWTLFSNHGHVLVCLARNPGARLRDVAADVGITERAVQKIVRDLQDEGMVGVTKQGRRNRYRIHLKQKLRHDLEAHCTLGELVKFVGSSNPDKSPTSKTAANESESVSGKPDEPKQATTEAPKKKPGSSKKVKPEVSKEEASKPATEDSIERQQGSLF